MLNNQPAPDQAADKSLETVPAALAIGAAHGTTARLPALWLLVALSAYGPFTMNAAMPAMPAMARDFTVSYGVIQLTLTLYLVAVAIAQLAVGPMSDRHGRRPVMLAGLGLFVLGSLICAMAPSTFVLVLGRCVQAVGGAAGLVLSRAVVHDIYGRDRAASVIAYVTMAMVIAPMLGPATGGYIADHSSWRWLFIGLALVGLVIGAIAVRHLHETRWLASSKGMQPVRLSDGLKLLGHPAFWAYVGVQAFATGAFFSFLGGAPYVVVELMQRPASEYGLFFVLSAFGYMSGNFLSGRYSPRFGVNTMIGYGSMVGLAGALLLWLLRDGFLIEAGGPLTIFVPMTFVAISNGLTLPNATAAAMSLKPELAGSASGVSGAIQIGFGALMTAIVGATLATTAMPMIIAMTVCLVAAALCTLIARHLTR